MADPRSYALLIGINNYADYDDAGGDNLQGAVNDAFAAARLCLSLGCEPKNIRIVVDDVGDWLSTTERLGDDLAGATLTRATRDRVVQGLRWMARKLRRPYAKGLVWYSGHGYSDDRGPAFCPSDVHLDADGQIRGLLRDKRALRILSEGPPRPPSSHLTAIIDACHSAPPTRTRSTRNLSASSQVAQFSPLGLEKMGNIVFAGSRAHEQAWELSSADQSEHGAFSWAILSLLERWGVTQTQIADTRWRDRYVDLSYHDLSFKVQQMLQVLEVNQSPRLYGPADQLERGVFHRFGNEDDTSGAPIESAPKELFPGSDGEVLEWSLNNTAGSEATMMYLAGANLGTTALQNGWANNTLYFNGDIPAGDFSISGGTANVSGTKRATLVSATSGRAYADADLLDYSQPTNETPDFLISKSASGSNWIGGLTHVVSADKLNWWATGDVDTIGAANTVTLYFVHKGGSETLTCESYRTDPAQPL